MSFRSMIQEMKGEIGAISRHGVRSLSHRSGRVRRVAAMEPVDALRQSCWEQLPPELLREVLVRIEESEGWWPCLRDVVACAGVCRSWRGIVKVIVRALEASGKLTFPISLKQIQFVGIQSGLSAVQELGRGVEGCCQQMRKSSESAIGLWELYHTLKSPRKLSGWTFQGGDPCGGGGERGPWHSVFCKGSSVVAINISGLGVGGWLGPELLKFHSLKELDVSFNNIAGEIPRTLPPSVEYLNLAANKFEGSIPPSLPWLHSLKYLNFSYNRFSGIIGVLDSTVFRVG